MPSDEDEAATGGHSGDTAAPAAGGVASSGVADDIPDDDDEADADAVLSGPLGDLLIQLEEATDEADDLAERASSIIVEGTAAGGSVAVSITASLEAVAVHIDPNLVDPADVTMLEDAVLAALRDALAQVRVVQQDLEGAFEDTELDLSAILGNLGNLANLGGLGLPDFGSLGNPEDLIAGLSGALGNLAGGPGGFSGLTDLMGGLGLSSNSPARTADDEADDDGGSDDGAATEEP
jgi:DNA-binding YbaB/EbfC family protein